MLEEHVISCWVENKPGVLSKISSMLRRRSFNIESISAGHSENPAVSRITIVVRGDDWLAQQVIKQLSKILEVIRISELAPGRAVIRELALVKVAPSSAKEREEVMQYARIYRARIVDVTDESTMVEIAGDPNKVNSFIDLMRDFKVIEVSRTGMTALSKGKRKAPGSRNASR